MRAASAGTVPVNKPLPNSLRQGPDARGRFGEFGGRFVAETLMPLILEVERAYMAARKDPAFQKSSTITSPIMSAGRRRCGLPSA